MFKKMLFLHSAKSDSNVTQTRTQIGFYGCDRDSDPCSTILHYTSILVYSGLMRAVALFSTSILLLHSSETLF